VALPLKDARRKTETTLLLSLGHFTVRHNTGPQCRDRCVDLADAALLQEATITGRDLFAAAVDGEIDWPSTGPPQTPLPTSLSEEPEEPEEVFLDAASDWDEAEGAHDLAGSVFSRSSGPFSAWLQRLEAGPNAVYSLLGQFEMSGRLLSSSAKPQRVRLSLDLPSIDLTYSPHRQHQIFRVAQSFATTFSGPQPYHAPEYGVELSALLISSSVRRWQPRSVPHPSLCARIRLRRGTQERLIHASLHTWQVGRAARRVPVHCRPPPGTHVQQLPPPRVQLSRGGDGAACRGGTAPRGGRVHQGGRRFVVCRHALAVHHPAATRLFTCSATPHRHPARATPRRLPASERVDSEGRRPSRSGQPVFSVVRVSRKALECCGLQ
jgi:hypothetical protein